MPRIIAIMLAVVLAGSAAGQEIRLRPAAASAEAAVRLDQVASLSGLDAAAAAIVVLTLPEAGVTRRVTIVDVQNALRRAGVNPIPIAFRGAAHCAVRRATTARPTAPGSARRPPPAATGVPAVPGMPAVSAEPGLPGTPKTPAAVTATLGRAVLAQLAGELGARDEDITVQFSRSSARTAAMAPGAEVAITSTDRNRLGRRRWRADYSINGRKYRRYLSATVTRQREMVIAERALIVGEIVAAGDVKLLRRADDGSAAAMTDLDAVVGQRVRRWVRRGQPVRPGDLAAPILVKRGQTAWVRCGPVKLPAKALGKGTKGDRVEFENPRNGKRFWAAITGPGTAEMALSPPATPQELKG